MSDPIVVGVDGTGRSVSALVWASHEASLRESPLRIVHTLPRYEGDIPFFPPGRFEIAEARGHQIMDEAVSLAGEVNPDVQISTDLPMTTPAGAMIAESEQAQMIVLGAKGEDIGNVLLGSTVLQVVGHSPCPVVVVCHVTTGHHRVAVGTDGSPDSAAALAFAFHEAQLHGSQVMVISALGLPQGWPTHLLLPVPTDNEEVAARRQDVEKQIAALREQYPDVEVVLDVHRIAPLHSLVEASHRSDLLVLGSRGRGGFHGLAVGSVTHKMLHLTGCPVAVVRSAP
ncbi:universal stress protein [Aeromicrobium sp. A1-2]|uniref:universal stress protein n=1 Tax=Aeromicrobium sp. A1-2 TaxID=2107713 RepID=UPI0013C2E766|nr:universal stress protein [Aeromicrobium sp. A1-2]